MKKKPLTIKLESIQLSVNDLNELCKIIHCLQVYDDIKKNGFKYPIVLMRGKLLRRGTLRLAIAKHLGIKELKAVIQGSSSEKQILKYTKTVTHPVGGYGDK